MATFAVTLVNGPRYDPSRGRREQDGWDEHAAFMDELAEDGFVILGGPFADGDDVLVVVEAENEDEVRRRYGEDPWSPMGILEIAQIRPWTIWVDGRRSAASG